VHQRSLNQTINCSKTLCDLSSVNMGEFDEVSYWVDLALGQGEFPRDASVSHVKWVRWLGSRLNGHRAHDIQEVVVSHSWVPL
jgi:hypothetical protein